MTSEPASSVPFDVARARQETPGVADVVHLNNAGAALPPAVVTDAVIAHLQREAHRGGYEAADEAATAMEATYASIARLIGGGPDEIALAESATRAWDSAFYALPLGPGDRILVSRAEYPSNMIAALQVAKRTGATIETLPNDDTGQVDVEAMRERMDEDVKLVAVTHIPTQSGLVNPVAEIGAVTREFAVPYLVDACQSVGQVRIDVDEIGCDALSTTGRKFLRGPRGTGFLYVRNSFLERLEPSFLDQHAAAWTSEDTYTLRPDARRFEQWEASIAGRLGLGAAVDYLLGWGIDAVERRVVELSDLLHAKLRALPRVEVHDPGRRHSGIVPFAVEGVSSDELQQSLRAQGINTSVARPATVWTYARADLPDLVRASVHYYNDEEDLDRLCAAVAAAGGA